MTFAHCQKRTNPGSKYRKHPYHHHFTQMVQRYKTPVFGCSPIIDEDFTCRAVVLVSEIKPVTVTKDLGVHINCFLNFNEHITKTASDCMFKLVRVNRIKQLLDQSTLMYLINAFIFCKLVDCLTVWSNTSTENIRKPQLVQNYACRIVTGLKKYNHISEALKSLK